MNQGKYIGMDVHQATISVVASRICSRSAGAISTGSKALTARRWNSVFRISLMDHLYVAIRNV